MLGATSRDAEVSRDLVRNTGRLPPRAWRHEGREGCQQSLARQKGVLQRAEGEWWVNTVSAKTIQEIWRQKELRPGLPSTPTPPPKSPWCSLQLTRPRRQKAKEADALVPRTWPSCAPSRANRCTVCWARGLGGETACLISVEWFEPKETTYLDFVLLNQ